MLRARLVVLIGAAWMVGAVGAASPPTPLMRLPPVMLWAWERPEDLRFIDVDAVGVAYLDRTVTLRGARIDVRPRQQPMRLRPETRIAAVVRVEADPAAASEADPHAVAGAIVQAARRRGVRLLQIDFDALASQRDLYRRVLHDLRRMIPPSLPLSITALASWCAGDRWVNDLPVDEAVPMLFEMGVDGPSIVRGIVDGDPFGASRCHGAIGVSTREPLRHLPSFDRAYVFNYRPWTASDVADAVRGVIP